MENDNCPPHHDVLFRTFVALLALIVGGAVGYYFGFDKGYETSIVVDNAQDATEEFQMNEEAVSESLNGVAGANPFAETNVNPFDNTTVNPFDDVKLNPFE